MAQSIEKKTQSKRGWSHLAMWAVLIVAGIVAKRVYGHGDWMVFFHLPAAVFLVVAFYQLSADVRAKYRQNLRWRASEPSR